MRDALSLFDQVLAFSGTEVRDEDVAALLGLIDRELLLARLAGGGAGDSLAMLELVESLADYGADYRNFARELLLALPRAAAPEAGARGSALLAAILPEERERLRPAGRRASRRKTCCASSTC